MKKIIPLIVLILITGCSINTKIKDTPSRKVEMYLNSYQKLDDNVMNDLDTLIEDTEYTVEQKARYKEIFKKHYSNMKYEIKEETVDGENATVDTEVEVTDYSDILTEDINEDDFKDDNGVYSITKYFDYQLDRLEKATNRIKYEITFTLTKKNGEWVVDDLDKKSMNKLHGIYIN